MADTHLPRLAFLGPLGTYSHQAAFNRFGRSVQYYERDTIANVFNALSDECPLALIPQENSLYGTVIETYDLFRSSCAGRDKFILGEVTQSIRHSLVVRKGTSLSGIKRILSHEQALGQCARFIEAHLPNASLVRVSSTAAAAVAISTSGEGACGDAAICSEHCASIFEGLEVLREGIQDDDSNITRFFVMSTSREREIPLQPATCPQHALLRIGSTVSPQKQLSVTDILVAIGLNVVRVDRRPLLGRQPFESYYFVELLDTRTDPAGADRAWKDGVEQGLIRLKDKGIDSVLLGIW
ncbi:PDT-domain-containing protein [Gloeophyllum trabeum ATCC 11539]|uniref:prephenate dehydratase n=1 Tax=Gloeophyllum trabeum (strain ATCC 11539 / FP-39264 / Madison 617) TaxID=670483 RepID=S7S056_GLOTA|nr:PDT-domain-containing protein [Gloeophyllum trabeum ATCC 11539]EPQ60725.1 PDT-domain-containing protein [Gloeophyllum trabeum ATCC 11539]